MLNPNTSASSSSRSHLVVGSLRQTQFYSSQFCHGLHLLRSDGSHVPVDTVHPSLFRSSSLSSPRWYHLQSLSFDVFLVSPPDVFKPHQSCFRAPLCVLFSTLSLSLMASFLAWSLISVWPHAWPSAHLHFCHFQFIHVGTSHWYCLHLVQHSWLNDHLVYLSLHVCWYSLVA